MDWVTTESKYCIPDVTTCIWNRVCNLWWFVPEAYPLFSCMLQVPTYHHSSVERGISPSSLNWSSSVCYCDLDHSLSVQCVQAGMQLQSAAVPSINILPGKNNNKSWFAFAPSVHSQISSVSIWEKWESWQKRCFNFLKGQVTGAILLL